MKKPMVMSLLSEKGQTDIGAIIALILFVPLLIWVGWEIAGIFELQETIIEIGRTVLVIIGFAAAIPVAYLVYRFLYSETIGIIVFLAWIGLLTPIVLGVSPNVVLVGAGIVAAMIIGLYFVQRKRIAVEQRQIEAEKRAFEEAQQKKGLVKYVDRHGNEIWDKPAKIEKLRKIDEEERIKESKLYKVVEAIEEFEPARKYGHEFPYQTDLRGWLKSKFPNTDIEIQRGSSRPDIIINDDIAIEVKGPTSAKELQSLADKCLRYARHFKELIIVLFELAVPEERYEEWKEGLMEHFPKVKVIRKNKSPNID